MSKFIVFSDLHAHPFRQFSVNNSRLLNSVNVIRDVFRKADEQGAESILFCGDLNHEQGKIDTDVINLCIDVIQEQHELYPSVKMYGISGNHDHKGKNLLSKPSQSALTALAKALPEVFVLWDNCADMVGGVYLCGIPYYEFPDDFYFVLDRMVASIPEGVESILLTHQTPAGSIDPVPSQIDPKDERFKKFSIIFNGHIHRTQDVAPHFHTVGSPLHQDLGDMGQVKYIISYDGESSLFQRHYLNYPQFRRVKFGETVPTEWEKDYILQDPPPAEENQTVDIDKFGANNSPRDIVQAYGEHKSIDQETINVGLNLLQP